MFDILRSCCILRECALSILHILNSLGATYDLGETNEDSRLMPILLAKVFNNIRGYAARVGFICK
jgi:hypothetical protein